MHSHRTAGGHAGVASPGSPQFEPQRRLLLELAVDPPADGDELAVLSETLDLPAAEVEAASDALERVGLCERRGDRLRATAALRAVEALWPLGL